MPKVVKNFKIIVAIGIEGAAIMHVDEKTSHFLDMTEEQASNQCIPHDIECSGAEDWLESLNIGKVFPGIYCMEGKAMFDEDSSDYEIVSRKMLFDVQNLDLEK